MEQKALNLTKKGMSTSRKQFMRMAINKPSRSIKLSQKKKEVQREQIESSIHFENLNLLRKMHEIEFRKNKNLSARNLSSLNIKNRIQTNQKIHNENKNIVKRLQSQKSRYPTTVFQEEYKRISGRSQTFRKSRKLKKINTEQCFQPSNSNVSYSLLPNVSDGFNNIRHVDHLEILIINKKTVRFEISHNHNFYYLLLQEFTPQKLFKLRLIKKTGEHLMDLIKDKTINVIDYLKRKKDTYTIGIIFSPFIRKYDFQLLMKLNTTNNKSRELVVGEPDSSQNCEQQFSQIKQKNKIKTVPNYYNIQQQHF